MTDIVTGISTAIGLTKQLLALADATKDAEAKLVIADLQIQLAELKVQLAGLIDENRELKEAVKTKSQGKPKLSLKGDLYFTEDGDGPYCTACADTTDKLVRVSPMSETFHDICKFKCNVCQGHYQGE
jgi:hypothetical protein